MGAAESLPAAPPAGDVSPTRRAGASPSALIVCGPSGVGKGTLIKALTDAAPDKFAFSVSHTTRKPRPGEEDGLHYHFVSKGEMQEAISNGELLEYAYVHENVYGTSMQAVQDVADSGRCCILDIDVQGCRLVRKSEIPAIFVFIAPPNEEELLRRLQERATESADSIRTRITNAKQEMESIQEPGLFDFLIVNDDLESAKQQLFQVAALALSGQDPTELDDEDDGEEEGAEVQGQQDQGQQEQTSNSSEHEKGAAQSQPRENQIGSSSRQEVESVEPEQMVETSEDSPVIPVQATEAVPEPSTAPESKAPDTSGDIASAGSNTIWSGMVAVVTGASSGIGWATALELLQGGIRVVAVARRRERLEKMQHEVAAQGINANDFLPIVCDITKEAEVLALPKIIAKRWANSGIDILVNCAGISRSKAGILTGSTSSWVEMISTNVLGLSMCTREAVQDMSRRGVQGHIINIGKAEGSDEGYFYLATKAAVSSLTEGLRAELKGRNLPVRVTLISPAKVDTEFSNASSKSVKGSVLNAQDVAAAVLWCLAAPHHVDVSKIDLLPTGRA